MENKREETPETIQDSGLSNKSLRIAILDDDPVVTSVVKEAIDSFFADKNLSCGTYSYQDPLGFLAEDKEYDLLFFDIEMPEIDGIETAARYRYRHPYVPLVFVSNRDDRVYDSFEVNPMGFVKKKNLKADIENVLNAYIEDSTDIDRRILSSLQLDKTTSVRYDQVIRAVLGKKENLVYTTGMQDPISLAGKTKTIEDILLSHGFIRINRNTLVNHRYIKTIADGFVTLTDGTSFRIGGKSAEKVKIIYMDMIQKESSLFL